MAGKGPTPPGLNRRLGVDDDPREVAAHGDQSRPHGPAAELHAEAKGAQDDARTQLQRALLAGSKYSAGCLRLAGARNHPHDNPDGPAILSAHTGLDHPAIEPQAALAARPAPAPAGGRTPPQAPTGARELGLHGQPQH